MIKLFPKPLLAVLTVLFVVALGSCEKDSERTTDQIQLLNFGPTGANHGDTLRFFGTNLDKVTAIQFTGVNAVVDKADFESQTAELILLLVPDAAEKGIVTMKTPQGDIVSKTVLNLGVTPEVATITAEARPGADITITGTYMNWVTSVTFAKDIEVTDFVSQSLNQLVVKIPAAAETGPLIIKYQGTDSGFYETADTVKVTLPKATTFAPNPVKHATNVTITGTDLDLVTKVYFNNVATAVTSFVSQSPTQLVVTVPGGAKKGTVKLEAASGLQTTSPVDMDVVLPAITSFTPNPVDPGANLTINGTNLDLVTAVVLENVAPITTFVTKTPTQIVVTVPAGVANGLITLKVLNSTVTTVSATILEISGAAPPPQIATHFYADALTWPGWLGGGWGGSKVMDNATPVRVGTKSVKIDYTASSYGSPLQLGGASISLATYTTFKVSIYPTAAMAGKKVRIVFNGAGGYEITLGAAGQWTDFAIPLGNISAATTLSEIWIQEPAGNAGTIYVDEIGLN
jgi:hypothetical protein